MEVEFATINCQGQTKFSTQKQLFLQDFVKNNSLDVVFPQGTDEISHQEIEYLQSFLMFWSRGKRME